MASQTYHLLNGDFEEGDSTYSVHCLNQMRQALHCDVYPAIPIHGSTDTGTFSMWRQMNLRLTRNQDLEDCIDHLRQSIICRGSTAVVPLKYFEGDYSDIECVKTDAVHSYLSQVRAHSAIRVEQIQRQVVYDQAEWTDRSRGKRVLKNELT